MDKEIKEETKEGLTLIVQRVKSGSRKFVSSGMQESLNIALKIELKNLN